MAGMLLCYKRLMMRELDTVHDVAFASYLHSHFGPCTDSIHPKCRQFFANINFHRHFMSIRFSVRCLTSAFSTRGVHMHCLLLFSLEFEQHMLSRKLLRICFYLLQIGQILCSGISLSRSGVSELQLFSPTHHSTD